MSEKDRAAFDALQKVLRDHQISISAFGVRPLVVYNSEGNVIWDGYELPVHESLASQLKRQAESCLPERG